MIGTQGETAVAAVGICSLFSMLYLDEFIRLGIILWYMNSGKWIKPVTALGQKSLEEWKIRKHGG